MNAQSEFVERSVTAAADLALFYVGIPDDAMTQSLDEVRSNLTASLAEPFGPDIATAIAREFVKAVASRRREIEEVSVAPSRVLN
jgi:hypothetical protein